MNTDVLDPGYGILAAEMDVEFYLHRYSDVDASKVDPVSHYLHLGWKEDRDPAAWFSTRHYLSDHVDVKNAGMNPLLHYIQYGRGEGRKVRAASELSYRPVPLEATQAFEVREEVDAGVYLREIEQRAQDIVKFIEPEIDELYYSEQLRSTGASLDGLNLSLHYAMFGVEEGLDPTDWFSTRGYLAANRDVEAAGVNPFFHYIVAGREEGRALSPALSIRPGQDYETEIIRTEFDADFYCGEYPDIGASGVDPLQHFMVEGWREGRNPSPFFSVEDYLGNYQDVRDAGVNPFFHFLSAGRAEGHIGKPKLGFRYDVLKQSRSFADRVAEWRTWPMQSSPVDAVASNALAFRLAQLPRSSGASVYLSVSHDDFTKNTGGVQLVLMREAAGLAALGFDHIHLYPARPLLMVETEDRPASWGVLLNGDDLGIFSVAVVIDALAKAVGPGGRREFAVHSLLGLSPQRIADALDAVGARRGYFWVHDYASVCTNYTLMRNDVEFCGAPPPESAACSVCVYGASRKAQAAAHTAFAERFDLTIVAPSQAAMETWSHAAPMKSVAARVLRHCALVEAPASKGSARPPRAAAEGPLRIAFLGTPLVQKGWPEFRDLALKFGRHGRYEFHHFGRSSQAGLGIRHTPVSVSSDHLDAMVEAVKAAEIDVALIWSLWPETFCIAAYEAAAAGAAVLARRHSGNVAMSIEGGEIHGAVLDDEAALEALFETGEIEHWARRGREGKAYSLAFSRMTADLIERSDA